MDQCLTDTVLILLLNVMLRTLYAVTYIIAPHRLGPYKRDEYRVARGFCQLHHGRRWVQSMLHLHALLLKKVLGILLQTLCHALFFKHVCRQHTF